MKAVLEPLAASLGAQAVIVLSAMTPPVLAAVCLLPGVALLRRAPGAGQA